jgi:cytochrome c biogenesis protein CcdA
MISDKKLRQLVSEKGQRSKWPLQLVLFTVMFALVYGLLEFAFYGFTMEGHTINDLLLVMGKGAIVAFLMMVVRFARINYLIKKHHSDLEVFEKQQAEINKLF